MYKYIVSFDILREEGIFNFVPLNNCLKLIESDLHVKQKQIRYTFWINCLPPNLLKI